jgi:arsenite-transporting ATPase
MPFQNLLRDCPQFLFFGGKDGVEKTALTATAGLFMAEHNKKTLVLSTDPQRSLSDDFDQKISDEATQIKDVRDLYAVKVDTERLLEEWTEKHKEALLDIVEDATYLNRCNLYKFLHLSLPGMDEAYGPHKACRPYEGERV